jgi:Spy/CpxP family protein refolding chaperone
MRSGNTKSLWISALAIGLLATVAATATALGGHGGGRCGRGHGPGVAGLEHRLDRFDLSADVRAKALAIIDASRGNERALRDQLRAGHQKLRTLLASGAPDPAALDAQVDAVAAVAVQEHKLFLHTLVQIGAVMPAAQRAQWFEPPRGGGKNRPH